MNEDSMDETMMDVVPHQLMGVKKVKKNKNDKVGRYQLNSPIQPLNPLIENKMVWNAPIAKVKTKGNMALRKRYATQA